MYLAWTQNNFIDVIRTYLAWTQNNFIDFIRQYFSKFFTKIINHTFLSVQNPFQIILSTFDFFRKKLRKNLTDEIDEIILSPSEVHCRGSAHRTTRAQNGQTPTISQKWSKWALRPLSGIARLPISSKNASLGGGHFDGNT